MIRPIWEGKKVLVACVQFAPFEYTKHSEAMMQFMITASEHILKERIGFAREQNMPLDKSRSALAELAINSPDEYTHIYMYDTDMEVRLSHIERLLSHNVPVVSGTYFMGGFSSGRWFPCVASRGGTYITRDEIQKAERANQLIQVDGTGCGSLLIDVNLLREMGPPAFKDDWLVQNSTNWIKGEDVYFCDRCKLMNVPVYIDPKVRPLHYKEMAVGFDLHDPSHKVFHTPTMEN